MVGDDDDDDGHDDDGDDDEVKNYSYHSTRQAQLYGARMSLGHKPATLPGPQLPLRSSSCSFRGRGPGEIVTATE